jgi:hypothetical protein
MSLNRHRSASTCHYRTFFRCQSGNSSVPRLLVDLMALSSLRVLITQISLLSLRVL